MTLSKLKVLNGQSETLRVGIGQYKIAADGEVLTTVGLGSCVGVVVIDRFNKVIGLAHIMLPDSTQFSKVDRLGKFADLAIPSMVDEMIEKGADKRKLIAKIAGGASMFNFKDSKMNLNIGQRNCASVKEALGDLDIPLVAEDTGGNKGRTITVKDMVGEVEIRIVGVEVKII